MCVVVGMSETPAPLTERVFSRLQPSLLTSPIPSNTQRMREIETELKMFTGRKALLKELTEQLHQAENTQLEALLSGKIETLKVELR